MQLRCGSVRLEPRIEQSAASWMKVRTTARHDRDRTMREPGVQSRSCGGPGARSKLRRITRSWKTNLLESQEKNEAPTHLADSSKEREWSGDTCGWHGGDNSHARARSTR